MPRTLLSMTTTSPAVPAPLCSELSAARGLPLVGTAGCYAQVIAFELPPPWTPRLVGSRSSEARLDAALERIAAVRDVRVLALEPRSVDPRLVRVLRGRRHAPFRGYQRTDLLVPREDLPQVLEALASGSEEVAASAVAADGQRDLLVCTHGARDACCGKFGFRLYQQLARSVEMAGEGGATRVWRCSHLGGHRFAPTLLDLPSGRTFGRVGADDARAIVEGGRALLARLHAIYRGRSALPEPVQLVERELWLRSGEAFEDAALRWSVERRDDGAWDVELEAGIGGASPSRMRATVERAEVDAVSTPASCGRDPEREAPWKLADRAGPER